MTEKLPLWRVVAGFAVYGCLLLVGVLLAPVYVENYRLTSYMKTVAADPHSAAVPDEGIRAELLTRARALHLPLDAGEIQVAHPGGKLELRTKYAVKMNIALYAVDLHFHAEAHGR